MSVYDGEPGTASKGEWSTRTCCLGSTSSWPTVLVSMRLLNLIHNFYRNATLYPLTPVQLGAAGRRGLDSTCHRLPADLITRLSGEHDISRQRLRLETAVYAVAVSIMGIHSTYRSCELQMTGINHSTSGQSPHVRLVSLTLIRYRLRPPTA